MVKGFGMTWQQTLYGLAYANIVLLSATLPDYKAKTKEEDNDNEILDMSNPEHQTRIDKMLGITP